MTKHQLVLTALAAGKMHQYTPVQVQKLIFLIDRQLPKPFEGPHFNFRPYHYGPFDQDVYNVMDELAEKEFVVIDDSRRFRRFQLTPEGYDQGAAFLERLPPTAGEFVRKTSEFVRAQSFSSLVSAIYKAFPEMRANSVFQG